jgi:RimJ/RimL family protein N-acetyltransferase
MEIYIRPLEEKDAYTSYQWRNNQRIWVYTGLRVDREITPEIELEWIRTVLKRQNEKRFAICIKETGEYIGNVHFSDVTETNAQLHLFIGLPEYWNRGIATSALQLMIEKGFKDLGLKEIYGYIDIQNGASLRAAEKIGFREVSRDDKRIFVRITNE